MARYVAKIRDWPENERPRERLLLHGAASLSDAETLAIILRVGTRELTAIDLARKLLNDFGGFRGLDNRSAEEIVQFNGIGTAKAAQIKAALEIGKRVANEQAREREVFESSDDVYRLVGPPLRDLPREVFKVLFLTSRNSLLADRTLFEGSLTESLVSPREVIKEALNRSAASLVFVHNHPSGNPSPSDEDKRITGLLRRACDAVGISVLDHIIIGNSGYFSFADSGLM
jgi:DNA repair protein RadC